MNSFDVVNNGLGMIKDEMNSLIDENSALKLKVEELEQVSNSNDVVGYIYIVVHPCYPGLVKFGYSKDMRRRMREFNNAGWPDPHHCYAVYGITKDKPLDKKIHKLIDSIDPDIRYYPDKEFYKMTEERAYDILKAIAEVSCTEERLILNPFNDEYFNVGRVDEKSTSTDEETKSDKIVHMTFDGFVFNGKQYNCNKYTDVIRTLAKVLYSENPKIIDDIIDVPNQPVKFTSAPIIYGDNTVRTHKFDENVNIYIYDSFSADECIKHCFALIRLYGYKDKDLTLINLRAMAEEKPEDKTNPERSAPTAKHYSVYAKGDLPSGYYRNKKDTVRAYLDENGNWIMLSGSVVSTTKGSSCRISDSDIAERDKHVRNGMLVSDFCIGKVSPSTAAVYANLRSTSGREYWFTAKGVNVDVAFPREKIS